MYVLLVLPFLAFCIIASLAFVLLKQKKYALVMLALFFLVNWWTETIPLRPLFHSNKSDRFNVECFNVHSVGEDFEERASLIAIDILKNPPSFVYLTEYYGNRTSILDSLLRLQYDYYACSYSRYLETERFYSQWFIDSVYNLKIDTLDSNVIERCNQMPEIRSHLDRIWVYRIQIHEADDTVAIYCCHLDTNNYGTVRDSISDSGLGLFKHWKRFVNATEIGYVVRELETDAIVNSIRTEKYPYIVMGDMNDISGSYTIRNLQRADMKDTWWEKGFGYGCTFHDHGMRLRLDHILYDYKRLELNHVEVLDTDLSDHNAMEAGFMFR